MTNYNLVPYKINDSKTIEVTQIKDDVWLTQKQMAELFDCDKRTISYHLINIFNDEELDRKTAVQEIWTTANDGKQYNMDYYNLDAIISVGYRVNSKKGVAFRQWATRVIKNRIKQEYSRQNSFKSNKMDQINERGQRLRQLMKTKGITQMQVAKELGFTNEYICTCFYGKHFNPTIENWIKQFIEICEEEENERHFFNKSKQLLNIALKGDLNAIEKLKSLLDSVAIVYKD